MCKRNVLTIVAVVMFALAVGQVQAEPIEVPNGEFAIYKPGTNYTVTATFSSGGDYAPFTNGPNDVTMGSGTVLYDDGTSGTTFDMPGWTRVFDTDHGANATRPANVHILDGNTYVRAFGAWSGGETSRIQSVEPVGIIGAGTNYTLSAKVSGGGDTRVLRLIVDGQEVPPSSSVDPPDSELGDWQVISRTYEPADITAYIGQPMTIELGTDEPLDQPFAAFDDVSLSYEGGFQASDPIPADEATDVSSKPVLSWTPGELANTHNVYLDTVFDDVNDAVLADAVSPGQDANTYDPGRLDFDTQYFWRVDEVNAPPTSHVVFKGDVWSFTTELLAYPIENVTATASSSIEGEGAENTVNGSGLDPNDLHSTDPKAMWISEGGDPGSASIQYEFDKPQKLHEMLVWNYNGNTILTMYGLKEVTIEYSTDGTNFSQLENVPEFVQATGEKDYPADTTVAFNGAAAKYVKITANSNWGGGAGFFNQYGLSEVLFTAIPVSATEPNPEIGATGVAVDAILGWKAGREAASHDVYVGIDPDALILAGPVTEPAFDTTSLDLALGQTYHWRVDEVNDAETTTTWQSDIWSFSTPESLVVDDFESYNDLNPDDPESNRIFLVWIGGDDDPANGSQVGNDTFPFAEQFFVHGGDQAMPFFYSNAGGVTFSEAERTFADPQDWTKAAIQTLVLYLRADSLSQALDTTSSLTTDGSVGWFSQTANSYDGEDAAQSGGISHDEESLLQTTVSGAGTASFYWKVSSELDWDFLEFYIDDLLQDQTSGEVDWQQMTYTITAPGSHTLKWRYMKDAAASGGEDTGWVDKFEWDGGGQPALIPGNTGQLYVKVNGVKLDYPGNVADIEWMKWKIELADLASLGVNLQDVRTLAIGIAGDDASGTLYFDDFLLEPDVQESITIIGPNGDFQLYKPGTGYTVTADLNGNYAQGVGDNLTVKGGGEAVYSDGTTGTSVDCPGWISTIGPADLVGDGLDGSTTLHAFGTWSGGSGTTVVSAASLGEIAPDTYTLSAMVNGSGGPLMLELLVDGVALTPSSSVTPSLPTDGWQEISRTYDAGVVGDYVGQAMTIALGTVAEDLVGTWIAFDAVSLSSAP